MKKFSEDSLSDLSIELYYHVLQNFIHHIAAIQVDRPSFVAMREKLMMLWTTFDDAYQRLVQDEDAHEVTNLDMKRDSLIALLVSITQQWIQKIDVGTYISHAQNVWKVFSDYDLSQPVEVGNQKIQTIVDRLMEDKLLVDDLRMMGLSEMNQQIFVITKKISLLLAKKDAGRIISLVNEVKAARIFLDSHYRAMVTHLNAIQELCPQEDISEAAQQMNLLLSSRL